MVTAGSKQDKEPGRCDWCEGDPLYIRYHDEEWGVPERESLALFERLALEGMQAGLSWRTILAKRAHMQSVFYGFDPVRLAVAGAWDIENWLKDSRVIRHRGKLEALLANARAMLKMQEPFGEFLWSFVGGTPIQNRWRALSEVPSTTPASRAMADALKRRGFRFVGPTICYAFMQSAGLVNDHLVGCAAHARCAALGR